MFRIDALELTRMLMAFPTPQVGSSSMAGGGLWTAHDRPPVDNSRRWDAFHTVKPTCEDHKESAINCTVGWRG